MKRKNIIRQNIIQLLLALIIVILIGYISSFVFFRLDLTSEKRYTLSDYTKNMLQHLDDDVFIKIYLEGEDLPIGFKRMQRAIKEKLDDFEAYANTGFDYRIIDPFESEDKKVRDKIFQELTVNKRLEPIEIKAGSKEGTKTLKIIPGAVVYYKGYEISVNLLKNNQTLSAEVNLNNSIESLEYEFTNAIQKLQREKVPTVAFIEGHGEFYEIETVEIEKVLMEYYEVKRGKIGGQAGILDEFEAVIVAKPRRRFSEEDQFVLDQYLMNGGKIMWLIDGVTAEMDSIIYSERTIAMPNNFALDENLNANVQLFKYGTRVNPDLIKDLQCAKLKTADLLYLPIITNHSTHPVTKYISPVFTEFASTIDTVGISGDIRKIPLLKSSEKSKKINVYQPIIIDRKEMTQVGNAASYQNSHTIAYLLEGKFESIFKDRQYLPFVKQAGDSLKEKSVPTKMIVISDGDIIKNKITRNSRGDVQTIPLQQGNKEFLLNAVNYLCDDEGLMSIRSREIKLRLLDKAKISGERLKWQLINTVVPVVLIILCGIVISFIRKRKYART